MILGAMPMFVMEIISGLHGVGLDIRCTCYLLRNQYARYCR